MLFIYLLFILLVSVNTNNLSDVTALETILTLKPTSATSTSSNTKPSSFLGVRRANDRDFYDVAYCRQCACPKQHFYALDLYLKSACYNWNHLRLGFHNRLIFFESNHSTISLINNKIITKRYVDFTLNETPKKCWVNASYEAMYNFWTLLPAFNVKLLFDAERDKYLLKQTEPIKSQLQGGLVRIDITCDDREIYFLLVRFEGQKTYMINTSHVPMNLPSFLNPAVTTTSTNSPTMEVTENSGLTLEQKINAIVGASAGLLVAIVTCLSMMIFRYWKLYRRVRREQRSNKKMNKNHYEIGVTNSKQQSPQTYDPPLPPPPKQGRSMQPLHLTPRWTTYAQQKDDSNNDTKEKGSYGEDDIYDEVQINIYEKLENPIISDYSPLELNQSNELNQCCDQSTNVYNI